MVTNVRYYQGGYNPSASAGNKAEQWSSGALASDPAAGYTAYDAQGNITTQRALTTAEANYLAAQDATATQNANLATLQAAGIKAISDNQTYLAIASPTNAQVIAQVRALTQQLDGVMRQILSQLNGTS